MVIIVTAADRVQTAKEKNIKDCEWVDFRIDSKTMMLSHFVLALDPDSNLIKVLKDRYDVFNKYEKGSDFLKIMETIHAYENKYLGRNDRKLH